MYIKYIIKYSLENYQYTMRLEIYANDKAKEFYTTKNNYSSDSGFDLYCLEDIVIEPFQVATMDTGLICQPFITYTNKSMYDPYKHETEYKKIYTLEDEEYYVEHVDRNLLNETLTGYYVYPRSSISNTPLMLANTVGIIDIGYRGNIKCKVRNCSPTQYTLKKGISLFQLCTSNLKPFKEITFIEEKDIKKTERQGNGFGSTNK